MKRTRNVLDIFQPSIGSSKDFVHHGTNVAIVARTIVESLRKASKKNNVYRPDGVGKVSNYSSTSDRIFLVSRFCASWSDTSSTVRDERINNGPDRLWCERKKTSYSCSRKYLNTYHRKFLYIVYYVEYTYIMNRLSVLV